MLGLYFLGAVSGALLLAAGLVMEGKNDDEDNFWPALVGIVGFISYNMFFVGFIWEGVSMIWTF